MTAKLVVRLTPSGGVDAIDGVSADSEGRAYLKARVRAPAESGKANAALEALIAATLGLAKSRVSVTRGHIARVKTVTIEGASDADIAAMLSTYKDRP